MDPSSLDEFRESLLNDLHRTVFDSKIKIFVGTMDSPHFTHHRFGDILAYKRWVPSIAYTDIRDDLLRQIGLDLLNFEKLGVKEYYIWLYQIPSDTISPTIRYATHTV